MPYSTVTELRNNAKLVTIDLMDDTKVTDRIIQADKYIKSRLTGIIDFSLIITTPDYINLLSQYKTAELCFIYLYGAKREAKNVNDVEYWRQNFEDLINSIIEGEVKLIDGSGNNIQDDTNLINNISRPDIKPAFGLGDYGEFLDIEELQDKRPVED